MLTKQPIDISFAKGLDTKTDSKRVAFDNFLSLENTIFTKAGLLQKRNGYAEIEALPNDTFSYLTTLNDNLTAIGPTIAAYSEANLEWVSKGSYQPLSLSVLPLIRNSVNQTQCDAAIAPNGLVCTVYTQTVAGASTYLYAIADSVSGQNIVAPTLLPAGAGVVTGSPRVFVLGTYFVIAYTNNFSGSYHLQYICISSANPTVATTPQDIATGYTPASTVSWDGVVAADILYIAYNTTQGGQSIKITYLIPSVAISGGAPATALSFTSATDKASMMTLSADLSIPTAPVIYGAFYFAGSADYYVFAVNNAVYPATLTARFAPAAVVDAGGFTILNLASAAQNGQCTVFTENLIQYGSPTVITNFIRAVTVSSTGTVGTPYAVVRSVGLASKAFIVSGDIYFLAAFSTPFQPSYFLINGSTSTQANPVAVAKVAYENGGGYLTLGLPSVSVQGNVASVAYLYKDLVEALSTNANSQQTTTGGVYSQTGINLVNFTIGNTSIVSVEIATNLQIGGGFFWQYDGYLPVETNFFTWPEQINSSSSTSGGSITAQQYYYVFTYEWTDNQGNAYRSAPSVPITITNTGSTSSNTFLVPTQRLTYKIANPIKIVGYRWSTANQIYYQFTSITAPVLNDPTTDYVTIVDTQADSAIVGNNILYTTGGVIEDVNGPASNIISLFDTRLWLVDAEDPNLLWFSKQVIEATPVELSDLLTFYVAPTQAAQGSTGPITALSPLDDKLIIFKANAIYYINGTGPDNTGANNNYSQPIFVTSTVGCANPASIVFTPAGLMFQSDKGIWLLGRDMSTQYIGAPVEVYNSSTVQSAVNVPATNQVRFTLNTGQTLMYDYYYGQWGTFVGVPAISSTIYQQLHTFINAAGSTYQESPGLYLDGSNPVLMQFTSAWLKLANLQGYQRAYFFYILGQYLTPHKLYVSLAYDYNPAPQQSNLISPTNPSPLYGGSGADVASPFGNQSPYGGPGDLEQWRIFCAKQRCQAVQFSLQEIYDPSYGIPAGAGLTLSGLLGVFGFKSGFRPGQVKGSVG